MTTIAADHPELLADLGEDEVVERVGDEDPALPETRPEQAADAQRQQALDRVEARAEPVEPGVLPDPDALELVAAQADHDHRQRRPRRPSPPRWMRLAPATKNIVNAVSVMTIVVPRSGSLKTSAMIGATMIRNGTVPRPEAVDPRAALGEPVGQVDDQRELGDLGRMDRRQRPELEPARRATDDDVELGHEHEHEQDDRHDVERHRDEPEVAVVDPHHQRPSRRCRGSPTGSAARRSRTCRRPATGSP